MKIPIRLEEDKDPLLAKAELLKALNGTLHELRADMEEYERNRVSCIEERREAVRECFKARASAYEEIMRLLAPPPDVRVAVNDPKDSA